MSALKKQRVLSLLLLSIAVGGFFASCASTSKNSALQEDALYSEEPFGGFVEGTQRTVTHNGTKYTVYENELFALGYVIPPEASALPQSQNKRLGKAMSGETEVKVDLVTVSQNASTLIMVQDLGVRAYSVSSTDDAFIEELFKRDDFSENLEVSIAQVLEDAGFSAVHTSKGTQTFLYKTVPAIHISCQKDAKEYVYTCILQKRLRFLVFFILGNTDTALLEADFSRFYALPDGQPFVQG